jgi:hypothetical protein
MYKCPITIPDTWIKHTPITEGNGYRPNCKVLHKVDYGIHPFVIHTAAWDENGEEWSYFYGQYFHTVEEALSEFQLYWNGLTA